MSQQTDPPITPPASPPESPYAAWARKMTLLVLLTLAVVLDLTLLCQYYWTRSPLLTFLLANIIMSFVAGFSVRWVLRDQTALVRIFLALVVLATGLALLGLFSGGRVGIGPWKAGSSLFDWLDFSQLFMGLDTALLCLFAWRLPVPPAIALQPEPVVQPTSARKPRTIHPRRTAVSPAARGLPDQSVKVASASADTQPVKPRRKRLSRRTPHLKLSDSQEHRCPYCLELIDPDDPHGVVECKICHTLHHADCWAITGACQVPHYTS